MQKFVRNVGARIASAVSGAEGHKMADAILQECKSGLDELEQQVTSVRSQFATYAEQMMQSCEASVLLSKSVSDFYRAANNSARSESVRLYEEVQDAAANNAVAIYQRQLQMEDGVVSELDQWLQIIARVNEQIDEAERLRQAAETAASRLQTLQNKVDSRRQGGGGMFGQHSDMDLQNRIEETERAQKNFEADFISARDEVHGNVTRIMQKRFTMFDRIYVQILECQVQFFEGASKDVEGFRRSIRNYRRKFPRDSGSSMTSALANSLLRAASAETPGDASPPKERPIRAQQSAPVSSQTPVIVAGSSSVPVIVVEELQKKETDFIGDMMDFGNEADTESQPTGNTDFGDFGEFVAAQSGGGSVSGDAEYGMEVEATPPPEDAPPRTVRQVSDLFGLNLFGSSSHVHSDTELDHFHHAAAMNPKVPQRMSKTTMDIGKIPRDPSAGDMFTDDFWGSSPTASRPVSRTQSNARKLEPILSVDPMNDLMGSTRPTSTTSPRQPVPQQRPPQRPARATSLAAEDEKTREPPHLMQSVPPPATGTPGVLQTGHAGERREFVRKLQEEEKINHDNREQAQDEVEGIIREWEFKGEVRRNLRSLLTSMDRILWEGAKWKSVQMSDLLNPSKISKKYKKGLNAVHPDKISLARGFTPRQIAIAEGVFMALNEAWMEYETTQQ